ncbi:SLC5 family protein [Echinimonas agarilytica]|uniref:Sodium/solute symporter n=1 Tax=Echinimonas agarilytica TaxID=1215918 RepID=A0AA41W5D9_9GAMM|nr:sodium/solute symporter [Echinimonas agarilytica]MCM2679056.1 sodium/solute symporter [Echinimonas agarilytica]
MENISVDFGVLDWVAFFGYFILLSSIGYFAGKSHSRDNSGDYFLAGRTLPWYVVGSSYIAANISTDAFIGMVGSAMLFGIVVATPEWSSVIAFTFLIWIFIPFLLSAKVFTTPEFLEKRFNPQMRFFFALVTIITNVVAFLAATIYGSALLINGLFGIDIITAILLISAMTGLWSIWGGLKSVAWMDLLTVIIMIAGGISVTVFGLMYLSETGSIVDGFGVMVERNLATYGDWKTAVDSNIGNLLYGGTDTDTYNRLSVIQPLNHVTNPWTHWIFSFFFIGLWYTVINQFMIQRVLGAKNIWHARMGINLASIIKLILPFFLVLPGLIWFAARPDVMLGTWDEVKPAADMTYIHMIKELIPTFVKGILLAALFGAAQSTVSAVLASTYTIFTIDFYKNLIDKEASEKRQVHVGMISGIVFLLIAVALAIFITDLKISLFIYTQELYTFFAPPFSAVFLLGILWKRVNGKGAFTACVLGFALGITVKILASNGMVPDWLESYANQGLLNWAFCMVTCTVVSLMTAAPRPDQVTDNLTFNWRNMNIFEGTGGVWYKNVTFWWGLSVFGMCAIAFIFSVVLRP